MCGPLKPQTPGHLVFVVRDSNSSPQQGESDILQPQGNCPHHHKPHGTTLIWKKYSDPLLMFTQVKVAMHFSDLPFFCEILGSFTFLGLKQFKMKPCEKFHNSWTCETRGPNGTLIFCNGSQAKTVGNHQFTITMNSIVLSYNVHLCKHVICKVSSN